MKTLKKYWWVGFLLITTIIAGAAALLFKKRNQADTDNSNSNAPTEPAVVAGPDRTTPISWTANAARNTDTTIISKEIKGAMYPADAVRIAEAMGATAFFFPAGNGYIEYKMKGAFVKAVGFDALTSFYKQYNGTLYTRNGV